MKLTKKIKSIPLHVYIAIIISITIAIFTVKFIGKSPETRTIKIQIIGKEWSETSNNYNGYRPAYWLANKIKVGDIGKSSDGSNIAEVSKVDIFKRGSSDIDIKLVIDLKGYTNTKTNKFIFNGQTIESGSPIRLSLNNTLVLGQVIEDNYSEQSEKYENIIITAIIPSAQSWMTNQINIGDKAINYYDESTLATIVNKNVRPSSSVVLDINPRIEASRTPFLLGNSYKYHELELKIDIRVQNILNDYYFDHQNVQVGNKLWLFLEDIALREMIITNIETINDQQINK